jgi:hypothetical protein
MTTLNENQSDTHGKFVYESPDGGRTIFRRKLGETERTMTEEAVRQWDLFIKEKKEDTLWTDIRATADKDPELAEMLEKIKTYYCLKHWLE